MRISDWSSDLCSSDLVKLTRDGVPIVLHDDEVDRTTDGSGLVRDMSFAEIRRLDAGVRFDPAFRGGQVPSLEETLETCLRPGLAVNIEIKPCPRSAENTSELQSLMRISYAVFCFKKQK